MRNAFGFPSRRPGGRGLIALDRRQAGWLLACLAWTAFGAYCASGYPPCVDLPAHGAQLETAVRWLQGDGLVASYYRLHFTWGYGLIFWLLLPLAYATNGAVAVRAGLFITVILLPASWLSLAKAWGRSGVIVLLGLPYVFSFAYWYGYLPELFALCLAFFALAAFIRALDSGRWWVPALLVTATFFAHLLVFALLCLWVAVVALCEPDWRRGARAAAAALAGPAGLSLPKVWSMATKSVREGPWPKTEYAAASHLNWFFKNYRPEGYLVVAYPLLLTVVLLAAGLALREWNNKEGRERFLLFTATVALYAATPKTLAGIFLVSPRLAAPAGMLGLFLADLKRLPKWAVVGLFVLGVASLLESGRFHRDFAQAVAGLDQATKDHAPRVHGYFPSGGNQVLGSRHIYLEHLGQWWTASRGGVGQNFFADAEHHPVRFVAGKELPADVAHATEAELAPFEQMLVFGTTGMPDWLSRYRIVSRQGPWRLYERH